VAGVVVYISIRITNIRNGGRCVSCSHAEFLFCDDLILGSEGEREPPHKS